MRLVIKLLPCIFILALGNSIVAQDENKKNVFSGHLGVSVPINEFKETDFEYYAGWKDLYFCLCIFKKWFSLYRLI